MTLSFARGSRYTSSHTTSPFRGGAPWPGSFAFLLFAASLLAFSTGSPAAPLDPAPKADAKKDDGFAGRTKEGRAKLLKEFGGSEESEEAVMLGLAWLTQMQKKDGSWV